MGAGPAALTLAGQLVKRGQQVHLIAPEPLAAWVPNYGGWADQFDDAFASEFFEQTFAAPCVRLPKRGENVERVLPGKYVRINKTKFQESLLGVLHEQGAKFINSKVTEVSQEADKDILHLEDGSTLEFDLVIDGSGAQSTFTETQGTPKAAFQLAYGELVKTKPHGMRCGEMRFMDFTPIDDSDDVATFLYAMPLSHDTIFVEETILATRKQVSYDFLKERLHQRLSKEGIVVEAVLDEEYCRIPLGTALPKKKQVVIPFGGAAAMIHPASGYLLSKVVEMAPRLAELIVESKSDKKQMIQDAMELIWPQERRRCRELYLVGLEILTRMPQQRYWEFFDAFFSLPDHLWRGFLDDTMSPSELALTMSKMFALSKSSLRLSLIQNSLSHASGHLLKAAKPAWA
jgi:lycopene cyclase-like protein